MYVIHAGTCMSSLEGFLLITGSKRTLVLYTWFGKSRLGGTRWLPWRENHPLQPTTPMAHHTGHLPRQILNISLHMSRPLQPCIKAQLPNRSRLPHCLQGEGRALRWHVRLWRSEQVREVQLLPRGGEQRQLQTAYQWVLGDSQG